MKALILAAGFGSRLAPITDKIPKSLVPVNGKPVLMNQIDNLHENGITDITVISGYKAKKLKRAVRKISQKINVIENTNYAATNNMYSAHLGREAMDDSAFLMMNADVFFDSSAIRALLAFGNPDAIVVDIGRYLDDSMKVVEEKGKLVEISKLIPPERAKGCSIDVYKFSAAGGKAFFDKCAEYIKAGLVNKWSEVALNDILPSSDFKACPLEGRWCDIDNPEDLAAAEELFKD